jgi:hypothetical protein
MKRIAKLDFVAAGETADDFRTQHQLRVLSEREIGGVRRPVVVNEGGESAGLAQEPKGPEW